MSSATPATRSEATGETPLHVAREFLAAPAAHSHIVQLYEDESFLAEVVSHFIEGGLSAGEPSMIVASAAHQQAFCAGLSTRGLDVPALIAGGQLTLLDARATLDAFMVEGMPDAALFHRVVGGGLTQVRAGRGHARVRAYGEMVDLLCRDGRYDAAHRLEELWNDIGREHPMSLLCAYGMENFRDRNGAEPLLRVCGTHSHVLPTERYSLIVDEDARMREVTQLQQRARALETELEQRKKIEEELRDAIRLREEFLSVAGHELRTPLSAVQLLIQSTALIARKSGETRVVERLERAQRGVGRLSRLIDGLLDVSRIHAGRLDLEREELDLAEVAREVMATADPMVTLVADAPVRGFWDRTRLEQVLANLLSNAIKYSDGKPVELRVEAAGDRARMVVRDLGIGIAAADHGRIFERFERAVAVDHFGGLGLGLFIVKQIVEAHQGSIRVDSQLGQGSTFTVELPLNPSK